MDDGLKGNDKSQAQIPRALASKPSEIAGNRSFSTPETLREFSGVDIELAAEAENSGEGDLQTPQHTEEGGLELAIVHSTAPEWLPAGWRVEVRVRTSGSTAGTKDRYFIDPVSHRRFRSKKEVFNFLETGTLGRYKPRYKTAESDANHTVRPISKTVESASNDTPSHSSRSGKRHGSILEQKSDVRFDFLNRPAKVRWVLSSSTEGLWTPYIGDEELPESSKKSWVAALELISSGPYKF